MLGEKLAITSRKVQTTRFQIRAIITHNQSQIVFIDTPGFLNHAVNLIVRWSPPHGKASMMLSCGASNRCVPPVDQSKYMGYINKIMESKDEEPYPHFEQGG